jgi:hypothetical protein
METKANNEKKSLSVDELAEQLNNPAILQMAIAKATAMGMVPKQEAAKRVEEEEDTPPESIELPEGASTKDIIDAFNKALNDNLKYMAKQFDKKQQGVIQTVKAEKVQTEQQKVRDFAKGKEKYFQDPVFFRKMDQLYIANGGDINEAFEDAKKLLGAKEESKKEAKKQENTPVPNISLSETSDDDDKKEKGYTKTEDASKAALAKIMADMPNAAQIISGEGAEWAQ